MVDAVAIHELERPVGVGLGGAGEGRRAEDRPGAQVPGPAERRTLDHPPTIGRRE